MQIATHREIEIALMRASFHSNCSPACLRLFAASTTRHPYRDVSVPHLRHESCAKNIRLRGIRGKGGAKKEAAISCQDRGLYMLWIIRVRTSSGSVLT